MDPVTGLSLGRIAIGAAALASPTFSSRMFRLDGRSNPQLAYMVRMFGSREVALGALTLMARGSARRSFVSAGIAVDLADAVAGVLAARDGSVSKATGAFLAAPAVAAVAAGVAGSRT